MANVAPVGSEVQKIPGTRLYTWAAVPKNTVGDAVNAPGQKGVLHVKGTFGATVVLEGSNDGVTYKTLVDRWNVALSFTAEAVVETQTLPAYVRPSVTNAGTPAVDVLLVVAKY